MTLGEKIRLLRNERKVSIRKLSDLTGLSKSTLSDIENNKSKKPTVDTIQRIAQVLEIPISELFVQYNQGPEMIVDGEKQRGGKFTSKTSDVFLRSVARAKDRPKETQERIAEFINLILEQEDQN